MDSLVDSYSKIKFAKLINLNVKLGLLRDIFSLDNCERRSGRQLYKSRADTLCRYLIFLKYLPFFGILYRNK